MILTISRYEGPVRGWVDYRFVPRKDYGAYLESELWRQKREAALEAAEHCCERCGSERRLQVHHKTYERIGEERPQDLEVLCADCHAWEHTGLD